MATIQLLHGWGYDATLWDAVVARLAGQRIETLELGYFDKKKSALAARRDKAREEAWIAVGHSLGALWWLAEEDAGWDALVIIGGFPRFTSTADFPAGVPPRVLERMRRRFAENPAAVLDDFRRTCGAPGPMLPADLRPLAEGLDYLAQADGRARLAQRADDIHLLASRDDAIVPLAMSETAFAGLPGGQRHVCDDGGHALPFTRPEDCARLILDVAARLERNPQDV
ncbi:MAG: alpha/beta hydrolase [Betaproteobacteria bacterium HGW-Betaproteobacteria-11]|nr:MAG: alpha/beta hydrolase [Betaproteobacteria bacterium HGW-Betaproteobacteria-11]